MRISYSKLFTLNIFPRDYHTVSFTACASGSPVSINNKIIYTRLIKRKGMTQAEIHHLYTDKSAFHEV